MLAIGTVVGVAVGVSVLAADGVAFVVGVCVYHESPHPPTAVTTSATMIHFTTGLYMSSMNPAQQFARELTTQRGMPAHPEHVVVPARPSSLGGRPRNTGQALRRWTSDEGWTIS